MLLASVLAIGASSFAGCGDADCPSTFSNGEACSANGLECFRGADSCFCANGYWSCLPDLPLAIPPDMSQRDFSMPDEGPASD